MGKARLMERSTGFDVNLARELLWFRYAEHAGRIYELMTMAKPDALASRKSFEDAEQIVLTRVLIAADTARRLNTTSWTSDVAEDFWTTLFSARKRRTSLFPYDPTLVRKVVKEYLDLQHNVLDWELKKLVADYE
jgi:hypothetical protein